MDVIFNDYSVHEQYENVESLVDDLYEFTLLPVQKLNNYGYKLLGGFDTYSKRIIPGITINELFRFQRRFPELSKIKSILTSMINEPYWETDAKTDCNSYYSSELVEINKNKPNAITESVERDKILLSLHDNVFVCNEIYVKKNSNILKLNNINNIISVSKMLFINGDITFSDMLQSVTKNHNIIFCKDRSGRYYADSGFDEGAFCVEDGIKIASDFFRFVDGIENDSVSENFHDSVHHRDVTYYEFRTSLTEHRLFRIYYYVDGGKKYFINSYAKKEKTIPDRIKDYSVQIIKNLRR